MNIFADVKKDLRKQYKKDTTVLKLESYELDKDPKKCAMVGYDMMNMDDNGVPKKVKVFFHDAAGKSRGIQDFADENAMMHTQPGGMIRLDRFVQRADGSYLCGHMQRISKKEGNRVSRGEEFSVGVSRAWTKILPMRDDNGNIAEIQGSNNVFSRGRALVMPEQNAPVKATFGENFAESLRKVAKQAIEATPDKAKPAILLRHEPTTEGLANGTPNFLEIVLPNKTQNEAGNYVPMTKDQQLAVFDQHRTVQALLAKNESPDVKGQEFEAVPGFQLDVFGMLNDPHSGKRLENPRVQSMVNDTSRQFTLPKKPGQTRPDMVAHDKPEYKLSVISYEIPKTDDNGQASLVTLGPVPGVTASPDGGLSVTPNPYYADSQVQQAVDASNKAAENKQAQQPAPEAEQSAAQQPASTEQTSASAQAAKPEEPQPSEDDLDSAMSDFDDFDMDDLEQQLSNASL